MSLNGDKRQRQRLRSKSADRRRARILEFLERVWPMLPTGERGRRLTHAEEDQLLGYGPGGV